MVFAEAAIVIAVIYIIVRGHDLLVGNDLVTPGRSYLTIAVMSGLLVVHAFLEDDTTWLVIWLAVLAFTGYLGAKYYRDRRGSAA